MENNKKLTLCEIPNAFIQFFNNKDYENKSKLFNNTETDQWWVSGDKNVYPFADWMDSKLFKMDMINIQ
ncbi:hypothetical protein ACTFIW_012584 [Dictyostelium discoideum]